MSSKRSREIADRGERRLHRTLDWATFWTIVVVVVVFGGATLGLVRWSGNTHGFWSLALNIAAGLVGFFGFLLVTVGGLSQLWKDKRDEKKVDEEDPGDPAGTRCGSRPGRCVSPRPGPRRL